MNAEPTLTTKPSDRLFVVGLFVPGLLMGLVLPIVAIPWFVAAWIYVLARPNLAPLRSFASVVTIVAAVLIGAKAAIVAFT